MEEKRIFIGSMLQTDKLEEVFKQLKKDLDGHAHIKWTKTPKNFHITYRFIGNLDMEKIKKIDDFLNNHFSHPEKIFFKIKGINYFRRKGKPAILYAEIHGEEGKKLEEIQRKVENFLIKEGIVTNNDKKFTPHITLGRIKSSSPDFDKTITSYKNKELGEINNINIEIIESELSPDGATYKPLKI